jgi:eukaryotic-like serine/threonine-protein kinase
MKICPTCAELYPMDAAFCPLDGTPLKRSTDPYLGRTLAGRYRLIRRLGVGGMAVVYLARHVMIERLSAIKILRQEMGMNAGHRERFLREARAVNRINHPNIVEITDVGEADGLVFLVMEYVAGETLARVLSTGPLAWPRAASLARQIASALARAHHAGVIHRDLKLDNVLIVPGPPDDPSGETAKLTDFGIAKVLDAPSLTLGEQTFGTPGYVAPEILLGEPFDARSDLYSLGIVLYEMLAGKLPFAAVTRAELLVVPLRAAPIPLLANAPAIPPELADLVMRMIERRPEARPADAVLVHEALTDFVRRSQAPLSAPLVEAAAPVAEDRRPSEPASSIGDRGTRELERSPTLEIRSRWHAAIVEVEAKIARAAKHGAGKADAVRRATELTGVAHVTMVAMEKAASRVSAHQAAVDALETRGRAFRASLGRSIDALVRQASRGRAHTAQIAARAGWLESEQKASAATDPGRSEALVWEAAALRAEEDRMRVVDEDLSRQIDELQAELDGRNEELEAELAGATGTLEGSLAAVRLLTRELVSTLDEAAQLVA